MIITIIERFFFVNCLWMDLDTRLRGYDKFFVELISVIPAQAGIQAVKPGFQINKSLNLRYHLKDMEIIQI